MNKRLSAVGIALCLLLFAALGFISQYPPYEGYLKVKMRNAKPNPNGLEADRGYTAFDFDSQHP